MNLSFLRLFDNPLSKYIVLKQFLACNDCFWLFTKIIKRSGTSFCCTFSAWFFCKNILYLILQCHAQCHTFFLSQDIKTKCVIEFLFRQLMTSWNLRFIFDHPLKQWLAGRKKWERQKYKKLNISRTKRALKMKLKAVFIVFEGLSFGKKIKIW